MYISQLYILSARGDKLVFKDYRQDIPANSDELFFRKYKFFDGETHQAPPGDCPPFFMEKGVGFAFLRRPGLLIVLATGRNVSPSLLGEALNRIAKVLKDYLGVLTEESIRKNFTMVYELLDEMIDSGVIQEISSEKLRPYIFNEPVQVENEDENAPSDSLMSRIRRGEFTERVRRSTATQFSILTGSKEHKNEIYIDIIERLNVVFNAQGSVITSEVDGSIIMKSFLAGSPEMFVGLNDDLVVGHSDSRSRYASVCLDSVNFHESADYSKFESDRVISMRPPDGEFTVMNYRVTSPSSHPFHILPSIELLSTYKVELTIRIRADIPSNCNGLQVVAKCPVPKTTTNVTVEFGVGAKDQEYEYRAVEQWVIWTIPKFQGGTEQVCKVRMSTSAPFTPTTRKEVGPISLTFEVPMHCVTGLGIKYLRIEERSQSYDPQRWVRNLTQANSYVARVT